jgi:predicted transcriptional regulator
MSSAAIISIKPEYANQILAGTKTIELRKSAMGLGPQDVLLVYSSAPEQQLSFWFRIWKVETLPVAEMWRRYEDRLGIGREDYEAYFTSTETATGFHVGEIHRLKPVPLTEIQRAVEGFVPPQGMIWFRDEFGRYKRLLSKLSDPLPKDVFPQLALELGAVQSVPHSEQ